MSSQSPSNLPPLSRLRVDKGKPCPHCNRADYHRVGCIATMQTISEARQTLRNAQPRPTNTAADGGALFVNRKRSIFRGDIHIATTISTTMAKRIANALNVYMPNAEGA